MILIKDIDMPTQYGICVTIFPDGRVTGEFSQMVIGHAQEVQHGKWITDGNQTKCSICGNPIPINKIIYCGEVAWERNTVIKYCPCCGALMDIEEEVN